ncbi:hypothetical protein TNCV_4624881 [Trichonephila clavipes]|nr:hypothetical protein TNCV_4624881 [Trichonephila clavipes]
MLDWSNEMLDWSNEMLDRSNDMLDRSNDMLDRSNDMLDKPNEIFGHVKHFLLAGPSNVVLKHRVDSIGPERLFSINERTLAERSNLGIPRKKGDRVNSTRSPFFRVQFFFTKLKRQSWV